MTILGEHTFGKTKIDPGLVIVNPFVSVAILAVTLGLEITTETTAAIVVEVEST